MKHKLPWNVTGIPPEAREIVRAAAHREGITVGEWLTRRILAEPSEPQEADTALRHRTEAAGDTSSRIDDTLHQFTSRLEQGERLQREAQQAMSMAASGINAATRDQAQAFQHLTARIDRIERNGDATATRDAIRSLHQGLSHLADQIATNANESAAQIGTLSAAVETLAGKLAATHGEADTLARVLEERIETLTGRLKLAEDRFGDRLRETEERMATAENRQEETLGRHLNGIERALENINSRLERSESDAGNSMSVQESLRSLTARIASAEKAARESLQAAQRREAAGADDRELPPIVQTALPNPQVSPHSGNAMSVAAEAATPQRNAIEPSKHDYLAQARRAAQASAEANEDTLRRSRRMRIPSELKEPERKAGFRRPLAAAAAVLLIAGSGYYVVGWETGTKPTAVSKAMAVEALTMPVNPAARYGIASLSSPPNAARAGQPPAQALDTASLGSNVPMPAGSLASSSLSNLVAQANAGDTDAAASLGLKYADGDGVSVNEPEAVRWLTKAATTGNAVAAYRLGTLYEHGRGVSLDTAQATHWYGEAAKHGNRRAMHNLAVAYADGTGGEKNYDEAARWFKAAAELGLTDSQFNLAVLYERGQGVKQSLSEAYKWYAIAAASGDTESKSRIAALANQLTPEEREAADRAAKTYKPQPINVAANGN